MTPQAKKPYRLVPADVPPRGTRTSVYDRVVADFIAGRAKSVRVEMPGSKPPSVRISLKKAIDRSGAKIALVARGSDTYLTK